MIGWLLFFTLLLIVLGIFENFMDAWGNVWGYPEKPLINWTTIWSIIILGWLIYLLNKFGIIKFWFQ